jgi:hypothetical protein
MGTIPEQRHPASSVNETERPIRQRPGIRVGGGLVNHLTPKKEPRLNNSHLNLIRISLAAGKRRQAEHLVKRLRSNRGIKWRSRAAGG